MAAGRRQFEEHLLDVINQHESVTDADVATALPTSTAEQRAVAFNSLLQSSRIQLVGSDYDNPRYKGIAAEEAIKTKGLSLEDMLVYQVISQAGNTGIWTRDMKQRTNLAQGKITKSLKLLEERGLVKAVKSVQNASRKVYMLSTLEPAKEITGGPWYGADQQPDKEFIETIRSVAAEYVRQTPKPVTVEDVTVFISERGVSNQVLQVEDVDNILKTLCYDIILERIEVEEDGEAVEKYRPARQPVPEATPFTDIPCGVCPVFNNCHEGGIVSPERCEYYKQWLAQLDF